LPLSHNSQGLSLFPGWWLSFPFFETLPSADPAVKVCRRNFRNTYLMQLFHRASPFADLVSPTTFSRPTPSPFPHHCRHGHQGNIHRQVLLTRSASVLLASGIIGLPFTVGPNGPPQRFAFSTFPVLINEPSRLLLSTLVSGILHRDRGGFVFLVDTSGCK